MKAFKMFVFGLFYGWWVKFAFDRIYRDNQIEDIRNENASLRQYIHSLERQVRQRPPAPAAVMPPVTPALESSAPARMRTRKDNLKLLKGVGPTIEKRLNEAGLYTFADIARRTPEQLEEMLGTLRRVSGRELIAEARRLAGKK